jgi:hypothetical protein
MSRKLAWLSSAVENPARSRHRSARVALSRGEVRLRDDRAPQPGARARRSRASCARPGGATRPDRATAASTSRPPRSAADAARRRATSHEPPLSAVGTHRCDVVGPRDRDPDRWHRRAARRRPPACRSAGRGRDDLRASAAVGPASGPPARPSARPARPSRTPSLATIGPPGAIAQLGERLDRTQEVGGSSPPSSMA